MSDELFRKYRPRSFKEIFGQPKIVKQLTTALKADSLPHQILFTGPSGCGKTTIARILKDKLNCSDRDFAEVNCADFRGIDMVRDIRKVINLQPLGGDSRIWLIDEAHKLTNDGQNALLKILEEPPRHAYIFLATTDPQKLIKTIQTRCTEVRTELLSTSSMKDLLGSIITKENGMLTENVIDKLVESAEGSARKALVILQTLLGLEDEDGQLQAILSADSKNQAISIARALMNPRTSWAEMSKIIKAVDDDPEGIRRLILAYASSTMLGNSTAIIPRAYQICVAFSENFFDTGRAGLISSCYEVLSRK